MIEDSEKRAGCRVCFYEFLTFYNRTEKFEEGVYFVVRK